MLQVGRWPQNVQLTKQISPSWLMTEPRVEASHVTTILTREASHPRLLVPALLAPGATLGSLCPAQGVSHDPGLHFSWIEGLTVPFPVGRVMLSNPSEPSHTMFSL